MKPVSHAAAIFGAGGDHWSSITAELCEPGQGTVYAFIKLKAFLTWEAMYNDANYLAATEVTRSGTTAWWVYGDKVRVALLTNERAFAESMMDVGRELEALAQRTLIDPSRLPEYRDYAVQSRRLIRAAVDAASVDSSATVYPPVDYAVDCEEITFSDSALEYTRYRPLENASIFYTGLFVSTATGRPLALHQNEPGVFSLSEPGYGMVIVSYITRRQMVCVPYDPWPDDLSPEACETLARDTILLGWPEDKVPKIVALASREEAPEIQALLTAPRKVAIDNSELLRGSAIKLAREPKLKEESRETETKTIAASNDPSQTITFKRIKKLTLRDQDGKLWKMELVNE